MGVSDTAVTVRDIFSRRGSIWTEGNEEWEARFGKCCVEDVVVAAAAAAAAEDEEVVVLFRPLPVRVRIP